MVSISAVGSRKALFVPLLVVAVQRVSAKHLLFANLFLFFIAAVSF